MNVPFLLRLSDVKLNAIAWKALSCCYKVDHSNSQQQAQLQFKSWKTATSGGSLSPDIRQCITSFCAVTICIDLLAGNVIVQSLAYSRPAHYCPQAA